MFALKRMTQTLTSFAKKTSVTCSGQTACRCYTGRHKQYRGLNTIPTFNNSKIHLDYSV